eukprot:3008549-Rhodomonas_salina.1
MEVVVVVMMARKLNLETRRPGVSTAWKGVRVPGPAGRPATASEGVTAARERVTSWRGQPANAKRVTAQSRPGRASSSPAWKRARRVTAGRAGGERVTGRPSSGPLPQCSPSGSGRVRAA